MKEVHKMEYTDKERELLNMMERTDFKSLKKNEVVSCFSQLTELRPEVAKQVLEQYPEFVSLVTTIMGEYINRVGDIVNSDNDSINAFYDIANKEIDNIVLNRQQYYELAVKVHEDLKRCLDDPNLTFDDKKEILLQEIEIMRIADEKDKELRAREKEIHESVYKKDSEKREFNWKLISAASSTVIIAIGIGASVLGGKFNMKLPHKS